MNTTIAETDNSFSPSPTHHPVEPTLSNLPIDLLSLVLEYSTVTDVYRLALTSWQLINNVEVASIPLACDNCDEDHLFSGVFRNPACGIFYARDCTRCKARVCRNCIAACDYPCENCCDAIESYYNDQHRIDEMFRGR